MSASVVSDIIRPREPKAIELGRTDPAGELATA